MTQFAAPEHLRSDPSIIVVGEDGNGCWTVEENHGLIRGRFRHRADAIRFAKSERDQLPDAIVMVQPPRVPDAHWSPGTS